MNKVAVITGAGRGIGFQLCKEFLNAGYHTVGISRNTEELKKLNQVETLSLDLTLSESIGAVSERLNEYTHLDEIVIIHNAGVLINKAFELVCDEEIDTLYKINYLTPLKLTRALIPWLKSSKKAQCIFIGSMGGFQGSAKYPGLSVYSSMKSAVSSLGECLAEEYKETTISFNTLALGAVDTDMLQSAFPGFRPDVSSERMAKWIFTFISSSLGVINGKVIPVAGSNP